MATVPGPWQHGGRDELSGRTPPHNLEAEMSTIGSVILNPATLKAVRDILRGPEDFYRDTHATLYRVACELADAGKPVDAVSLADELTRQGDLTEVGGIDVIAEVVNSVPSAVNATYYAEIVRQKADTRELIQAAENILRDGYGNQLAASAILARARRSIDAVEGRLRDQGWQPPELDAAAAACPFPVDVLPPPVRRFVVEVSASVPCPPDFTAVPVLAVAGAALGRSVGLRVKPGWNEEGNIWAAIVAMPGTGKTPPVKAATAPLRRIFEEQLRWHEVQVEAAKARARELSAERKKVGGKAAAEPDEPPPQLKRTLVGDATIEALNLRLRDNPRGLIMVLDELAGLMNGMNQYKNGGGNDEESFLALWSRSPVPIDRKGQEGGIPIWVRDPFFAMTGGLQPDKLHSIGTTKDGRRINDGFIDRFLFAFPDEIPMRWTDECVSDGAVEDWERAVRRLWERPMVAEKDSDYERPYWVDWTPEARARFVEWFDGNCLQMQESDFPPEMKGPLSKVRAYCARLALILEQLWWACDIDATDVPPRVGLDSVNGAIRLSEYFESHYRRVVAFLGGAPGDNPDAAAIMKWLEGREAKRFTLREVRDNFRKRFADKPESLASALDWLEERGVVRKLPDPYRPTGGRKPTAVFELNPSLGISAQNAQPRSR